MMFYPSACSGRHQGWQACKQAEAQGEAAARKTDRDTRACPSKEDLSRITFRPPLKCLKCDWNLPRLRSSHQDIEQSCTATCTTMSQTRSTAAVTFQTTGNIYIHTFYSFRKAKWLFAPRYADRCSVSTSEFKDNRHIHRLAHHPPRRHREQALHVGNTQQRRQGMWDEPLLLALTACQTICSANRTAGTASPTLPEQPHACRVVRSHRPRAAATADFPLQDEVTREQPSFCREDLICGRA